MESLLNKNWDEIIAEDELESENSNFDDKMTQPRIPEASEPVANELDPVADQPPLQIPIRNYTTQIIRHQYAFYPQYKSEKDNGKRIILFHKIIEGQFMGLVLKQFFTFPEKFNSNHKYWQSYVLITDSLPSRNNRMSAKNLIGTVCLSSIGFSKRKFKNSNDVKPQLLQESQVLDILKVLQRNGGNKC